MNAHLNYIGGAWVPAQAGGTFERRNPADSSDLIGVFPASAAADAVSAVVSVRKSRREWASLEPEARARVLEKAADIILRRIESNPRDNAGKKARLLVLRPRNGAEHPLTSGYTPRRLTAFGEKRSQSQDRDSCCRPGSLWAPWLQ